MKPGTLFLLCLVLTVVAIADSKPPVKTAPQTKQITANLARIAEQIRSGEINVGNDYSMNFETGRFHIIHADKMLIDCNNCHYGSAYKKDYQIMGKSKPMPDKMPGRLQRGVCLGCHGEGGIASHWYGRTAEW